jgi:uncharacterized protein with HEPN domain
MAAAARRSLQYLDDLFADDEESAAIAEDVVGRQLIILGEAAKNVTDATKAAHGEIDWAGAARLRDVIVHQYHRVTWARVVEEAGAALPPMIEGLERILADLEDDDEQP